MIDSSRKWRFPFTFGTFADLRADIETVRTYLWQQREYLSEEEKVILESMLSHYLLVQANLIEIKNVQDEFFDGGN